MSNIDNHFNQVEKKTRVNTGDYSEKQEYTSTTISLLKVYIAAIPSIMAEYDDLEKRFKTKECKAFKEKMDGLAALKKLFDSDYFQNMKYWYIDEPKSKL